MGWAEGTSPHKDRGIPVQSQDRRTMPGVSFSRAVVSVWLASFKGPLEIPDGTARPWDPFWSGLWHTGAKKRTKNFCHFPH